MDDATVSLSPPLPKPRKFKQSDLQQTPSIPPIPKPRKTETVFDEKKPILTQHEFDTGKPYIAKDFKEINDIPLPSKCEKFVQQEKCQCTPDTTQRINSIPSDYFGITTQDSFFQVSLEWMTSAFDKQNSPFLGQNAESVHTRKHLMGSQVSQADPEPTQLDTRIIHRVSSVRVSRSTQSCAVWQVSESSQPVPPTDVTKNDSYSRSNWLQVHIGKRVHAMWVEFDRRLVSIYKKRTDKFSEIVFPASSINHVAPSNITKFSVNIGTKCFEFSAPTRAICDGWVTSLSNPLPEEPSDPAVLEGILVLKELRSKLYVALKRDKLWLYQDREHFREGIGITVINLIVAQVKKTGKHGFDITTPYKTFNFTTSSIHELSTWVSTLSQAIKDSISFDEVAKRIWENPSNKLCADCQSPDPEWASVNLIVVICNKCSGIHRSLGVRLSKVRSIMFDRKVWTEPLIMLFMLYGNKLANEIWGHHIPTNEQIFPDASPEQRKAFIWAKYHQGRYCKLHTLFPNSELLYKRLCTVACSSDIMETMSLLCSGAQLSYTLQDGLSPTALAKRAGQMLQAELMQLNENIDFPHLKDLASKNDNNRKNSSSSDKEFIGNLETDKLIYEKEESGPIDCLELKNVISLFDTSDGQVCEYIMITQKEKLQCTADNQEILREHLGHIAKVLLPFEVQDSELEGMVAVSKVYVKDGEQQGRKEAWAALRGTDLLLRYTSDKPRTNKVKQSPVLIPLQHSDFDSLENTIQIVTSNRTLSLMFPNLLSCQMWRNQMERVLFTGTPGESPLGSLYPSEELVCESLPPAIERCISHITKYGLTIEGIYRRCGQAIKVGQLVECLNKAPANVQFDEEEQGVLDVAAAMKQCLRLQEPLFAESSFMLWQRASSLQDEAERIKAYKRTLQQLPAKQKSALHDFFGHLFQVHLYSSTNLMTAQNLALVLTPTVFFNKAISSELVCLIRELITHYTSVFKELGEEGETSRF
ncbi:arf-GAP with Rho-GAP domain, ANK repeat and PH domain-containing protein 1 isoform X1 [Polypterus senegalus]|uniref:arf-GAP with Rho-GAP domain, ANK repeat and PH domain-containing protein 1 isoform X1 n=2 Tax=Polypterus senegalus TaxID=55291 RepID=UPI001964B6E5|nr:arf-GAP with Rho-GAP domain, ANK repeat and PH domain-containing protein 1 isoform X1 [Polypterus senegalus]XP_039622061.1 arf-GAP with Rho-GAP domain, ANK repeat and PH domain-containing protein 1 isoform X1 [Polypterus senegalus]